MAINPCSERSPAAPGQPGAEFAALDVVTAGESLTPPALRVEVDRVDAGAASPTGRCAEPRGAATTEYPARPTCSGYASGPSRPPEPPTLSDRASQAASREWEHAHADWKARKTAWDANVTTWDKSWGELNTHLAALARHADTLGGWDGLFGRTELDEWASRPDSPADLRAACQFFVNRRDQWAALDVAAGVGVPDSTVGMADIRARLAQIPTRPAPFLGPEPRRPTGAPIGAGTPSESARTPTSPQGPNEYGPSRAPPTRSVPERSAVPRATAPPGTPPTFAPRPLAEAATRVSAEPPHRPTVPVADVRALFASGMSLEEVVMAILGGGLQRLDGELESAISGLDQANARLAGAQRAKGSGGSEADVTAARGDVDKLQMRLQSLMEKRQQMFQLMSTMSSKFNETAKSILANLGRA